MDERIVEKADVPVDAAPAKGKKSSFRKALLSTVLMLCGAVAAAVLIAYVWMPVLQIYGNSMNPTLGDGDVVVAVKATKVEVGDIVAIDFNNKLLIRRVIGVGGDTVQVAESGLVIVNSETQEEPYVAQPHNGDADVETPCEVPDGSLFVMGDNREEAVDSRHSTVGFVTEEQIIGKVILQVWPMNEFGVVK